MVHRWDFQRHFTFLFPLVTKTVNTKVVFVIKPKHRIYTVCIQVTNIVNTRIVFIKSKHRIYTICILLTKTINTRVVFIKTKHRIYTI